MAVLLAGFACGCRPVPVSDAERIADIRRRIYQIRVEVVDLTNVQEPLGNDEFNRLRDGMTVETGELLVRLITNRVDRGFNADLAVLALTGLSESNYWNVTFELLAGSIDDDRKSLILSPYCYGPGYARAFRDTAMSNRLVQVASLTKSDAIKQTVAGIVSGAAERHWDAVLAEPDAYGWNPEYFERFQPGKKPNSGGL